MLHTYTEQQIYAETERLAHEEREVTTKILHHLRELERRRAFKGYPSLFAYAVNELKYSEDQAYRRIAAMRLLKEMPQIEEKISSGELTLTHVGLAQAVFKREKKEGRAFSKEKKLELVSAIVGKSTREAEKITFQFVPESAHMPDVVKSVGSNRNRATIELSDETLRKIEQLKGLFAHTDPGISLDELINKACDMSIEKLTPKASTKRGKVWHRDNGACRTCGSQFALEIDHIRPRAKGGGDEPKNLRLLCRTCNQRAALKEFGAQKMKSFLKSRRVSYAPAAPRVPGFETVRVGRSIAQKA